MESVADKIRKKLNTKDVKEEEKTTTRSRAEIIKKVQRTRREMRKRGVRK